MSYIDTMMCVGISKLCDNEPSITLVLSIGATTEKSIKQFSTTVMKYARYRARKVIELCTHTTVSSGQQVCGGVEGGCGEDAARRQVSGWLIAMAIGMSGLVIIVNMDSS